MKKAIYTAKKEEGNVMRDLIIIIVIVGLIISGSYFTYKYYEDIKSEFDEKLTEMSKELEDNFFNEQMITDLENIWLSNEGTLIIFQSHDLVGDIEENLYECFHYYKNMKKEDFDLEKQKVISGLDDLIKRECLSIVNIL